MSEKKLYVRKAAGEPMLNKLQKDAEEIFEKYIKNQKKWHSMERLLLVIKKTQDHFHILGHFRGAAHNKCNLNCKIDS